MGLLSAVGSGPVALDTAVFIYFFEEHPRYLSLVEPLFSAIDAGRLKAVTSSLTLLETLVMPLRQGNAALAGTYESYLTRGRGLRLIRMDLLVLRAAAHLRAAARLKTPDSLQVATAQLTGSTAFITNDGRLPALPGLPVLCLEDFLPG